MVGRANWTEIARRAEEAEREDELLDAEVRMLAFAPTAAFLEQSPINGAWCIYETGLSGKRRLWEPRRREHSGAPYTASVDACLALLSDVLPGWTYVLGGGPGKSCGASLFERDGAGPEVAQATGKTMPLALLAAIARAMAASGIDARSDETRSGSSEGESPAPKGGDVHE